MVPVAPGATGKIIGVDTETNGPLGLPWAVGAAMVEAWPELGVGVVDRFGGQLAPGEVTDPDTRRDVLPAVRLPRYASRAELLEGSGAWWVARREGVLCVAGGPAGVGAQLFRLWAERDPQNRRHLMPAPLHELGSALWMAGYDPATTDRRGFSRRPDLTPHDPVDGATVAALCMVRLAGMRPQLRE